MTFAQIYGRVIDFRFNSSTSKTAQVKEWVNQAEIALWNSADWNFKRPPSVTLAVDAAGAATEPADFDRVIRLWDPRGFEVLYMNPEDFEDTYIAPVPVPTGNAEHYTVIDRQIIVGPAEASSSYRLSYQRRYTKRNSGGSAVQGVMSADLDTPYWDSEHHYILVPWAIRIGKYLEDDATATLIDQVLEGLQETSMYRNMVEQLATPHGTKRVRRYWGVRSGEFAS